MSVLIGGLVAVLGIGAAVGIVLAAKGDDEPGSSQGTVATTGPRTSPGPVASIKPPPTQGPNPTAVTPTGNVPTTATPTQNTGGGTGGSSQTLSNDYVAVTVPKDWKSEVDETSVAAYPPLLGSLLLVQGAVDSTVTATQLLKGDVDWYKANRTDVTVCGKEDDYNLHNGPAGRGLTLCYTAKTTSGKAYPAQIFIAVGTQASSDGTFYFRLSVFASDDDWDAVVKALNPVLPSIHWKLYTGS
ncbi:MAG: hypothetical protein ABIZ52_00095 [Candidatus Limnocylindrales bacterium]